MTELLHNRPRHQSAVEHNQDPRTHVDNQLRIVGSA
jgi:hypothetical protein